MKEHTNRRERACTEAGVIPYTPFFPSWRSSLYSTQRGVLWFDLALNKKGALELIPNQNQNKEERGGGGGGIEKE